MMKILAHAKVNFSLRILGKRADGYHAIETLMVPISLADVVEVETSEGSGIEVTCDEAEVPADSRNLAWQAAEVFARRVGWRCAVQIVLRKHIPHGAGLGGGSSDAAAVLTGLNTLLGTGLGEAGLEKIAAEIGSDVPFFIRSRPQWCRGRGEIMEEAGGIPQAHLLLVKPAFPVSTAWAYSQKPGGTADAVQAHGAIELANDLEAPVFRKFLILPTIKSWLLAQPEVSAAMMSGSGSTIFAILKTDAGGLPARARARFGESLWTQECQTL